MKKRMNRLLETQNGLAMKMVGIIIAVLFLCIVAVYAKTYIEYGKWYLDYPQIPMDELVFYSFPRTSVNKIRDDKATQVFIGINMINVLFFFRNKKYWKMMVFIILISMILYII